VAWNCDAKKLLIMQPPSFLPGFILHDHPVRTGKPSLREKRIQLISSFGQGPHAPLKETDGLPPRTRGDRRWGRPNSRVINRHLEGNSLNSGEFDWLSGMKHSLQKESFVKSCVANFGRLRSFDEPDWGSRPAKCKE
jgi:hypothetical protein